MKTYPAFRQTNDLQALQGRLEELEEALAKSLQNQRALQEHVEFLLENDAVLRAQLDDLEEGNRQKESILTRELEKKTEEVEMLRRKVAELGDLLQESREAMESREGQLEEKESSIRRLEALLRQQKKIVQSLEAQRLYSSLSSFRQQRTPDKSESLQLQERYQKQVNELDYQLRRTQQALNSQRSKADRLERENLEFRRWLNRMVGVERVVAGCEKVIMKELQKRLATVQ